MKESDDFRKNINKMNRYLQEPFSEEEEQLIAGWLKKRDTDKLSGIEDDPSRLASIKNEIYDKIYSETSGKEKWGFSKKWINVAASIVLCTMLAGYWWVKHHADTPEFTTISNTSGQAEQTTLSDGSVLWLNGSSRVRIPGKFRDSERVVYLEEGEAFFEVSRNEEQPFIIHASGLKVKVLGTSFNVKSYKELHDVRVTVASGKVSVIKDREELGQLSKDNELVYHKTRDSFSVRNIESKKLGGWRNGAIYLEDVPLRDFILALEKKYLVDIDCPGELLEHERINIHVTPERQLEEVLEAVSKIYHIQYEIKENQVIIKLLS